MALRAGYYGIKKRLKNKLEVVAAGWDQVVKNTTKIVPENALVLAEGVTPNAADQFTVCKIGNLGIISIMVKGVEVAKSTWFELGVLANELDPDAVYQGTIAINSKTDVLDCLIQSDQKIRIRDNTGAIAATDIVKVWGVFVIREGATRSLSMAAAPEEIVKDEIEDPVVEKKTTTRKKSTAKADTTEEV